MGCTPLFCCFKDFNDILISIIALVANAISFIFFIWAIADLIWIRNGPKALFIISFVLIILCLICVIIVFIFILIRNGPNNMTFNNLGKYICLAIIILCILIFLFTLIGGIIEICDLKDIKGLSSHEWAALFVPGIFSLIASVVIALCANVLYKRFNDPVNLPQPNNQNPINQNSVTTISNIQGNNVVISGNSAAAIPPNMQNIQPNHVIVQQNTPM